MFVVTQWLPENFCLLLKVVMAIDKGHRKCIRCVNAQALKPMLNSNSENSPQTPPHIGTHNIRILLGILSVLVK